MTPYSSFLTEVVPYLPDVPEVVAENAVRNACIEFCEKTHLVQAEVPPIDIQALTADYVVPVPAGTKFVQVMTAYYGERLLIPKTQEELAHVFRRVNWMNLVGSPFYITKIVQTQVKLVPQPERDESDILSLRVSLAPTRTSTEVDDQLYNEWLEVIAHGAKHRLYSIPKQSFTDQTAAVQQLKLFRAGITRARIMVAKALSRASGSVELQRWA
jgi:hypothetical protein